MGLDVTFSIPARLYVNMQAGSVEAAELVVARLLKGLDGRGMVVTPTEPGGNRTIPGWEWVNDERVYVVEDAVATVEDVYDGEVGP